MNDTALLDLWEATLTLPPHQRAQRLAQAAGARKEASLGESNVALLRLREGMLGQHMPLRTACPQCAGELAFEVNTQQLQAMPDATPHGDDGYEVTLGQEQVRFRAPRGQDLSALASLAAQAPDAWARALFERCVLQARVNDADVAPAALSAQMQVAVASQIDALEPLASLAFELDCPSCHHHFAAPLDLAAVTFAELRHRAENVLADVAALANAYGWREADVLALSATRRAAYLQLASSATAQVGA
jgi:hypothetical protein